MKLTVYIFVIFFAAFSLHGEVPNEVLVYAKEFRIKKRLDEVRQEDILQKVCQILPKYNSSCLEGGVGAFLGDYFKESPMTLINSNQTAWSGKSHDEVFFIYAADGSLSYVVKAFQSPRSLLSKFIPEISGLLLIQELRLNSVKPVEILSLALCRVQDKEWGLILESAAGGRRMDSFFMELGKAKGQERETCYDLAQKAFACMGTAFGRLHKNVLKEGKGIDTTYLQRLDYKLTKLLLEEKVIAEIKKEVPLDSIVDYLQELKARSPELKVQKSYCHGDAHLNNLFYDPENNCFAFIDLCQVLESVDFFGEPLKDASSDLLRIEENFLRRSLGLLTEPEEAGLLEAFYASYKEEMGIDRDVLHFYRGFSKLCRLLRFGKHAEKENLQRQQVEKGVFDCALEYFKKQIMTSSR